MIRLPMKSDPTRPRPEPVTATVAIEGDLEHDNAGDFLADVDDAFAAVDADADGALELLVIDCSRLTFCDSSGLSALLSTYRRAQARGARLRLADQPPVLRDLLELTGTSTIFQDAQPPRAHDGEPAEGATDMRSCANVRDVDGHFVVELTGAIDLEYAEEVRNALNSAVIGMLARNPAGRPRLIIDVTDLEFADSTMLHLLIEARKHADVNLAGPLAPGMRLLFEVAGVNDLFPGHPSVRDAVLAVERSPQWKPVP